MNMQDANDRPQDADNIVVEELTHIPQMVLNTPQMARYLGLCEQSLIRSQIPRVQVGRRLLWPLKVIDAWMADNAFSPNGDDQ